ncbi:MAG: hypothetical protein LBC74_06160 [Planctomycetaceae bacterium]|jgi:hypothetical protein|nr:hypothetical protein [Planctomycetaceae bacterium]
MIIDLSLTFIPTAIQQSRWDIFWESTLRMLENFPVRLIRLADKRTDYGTIRLFSNKLTDSDVNGEFFAFSGDAVSFTMGQEIRVYHDIEYYRKQWHNIDEKIKDPLYCTWQDYDSNNENIHPELWGVKIFRSCTQGRPYHVAATGLIILAEHLFGDKCVGWDQIRLRECNEIRPWVSHFVNADVQIPVCMDASRLWNRIEGVCGDIDLTKRRFNERFIGLHTQKIHRLIAESRENTMRELAESLLSCNRIDSPEAVDISESFLEATDDLDMYLDLIDFRNSLAIANNKDSSKKQIPLFTLESVLRMLIMHQVTITRWQCQELYDFKRWMNMDGDDTYAASTSFIKSIVPRVFEFYCSKSDLLDTFYRRDPSAREQLEKVSNEAFETSDALTDRLATVIREIKDKAEEAYPIGNSGPLTPSFETFPHFIDAEARVLSHSLEPLSNKEVIKLAQRANSLLHVRDSLNFGVDTDELFNDTSGEMQKTVIANMISDYALPILESTWNMIVALEDDKMLNLLALMTTVSTTKEYSKIKPVIIQLVNHTRFWKLFKESTLSTTSSSPSNKIKRKK